jgi:hypothetical protein
VRVLVRAIEHLIADTVTDTNWELNFIQENLGQGVSSLQPLAFLRGALDGFRQVRVHSNNAESWWVTVCAREPSTPLNPAASNRSIGKVAPRGSKIEDIG